MPVSRGLNLRDAWSEFEASCREFGVSLELALADKSAELRARQVLRCLPHGHLSEAQLPEFVALVLGRSADAELLSRIERQRRRLRLSEDDKITIERRQFDRCAICGSYLSRESAPHADHIVPISLGGDDDLPNIQLLCARCNLGKSNLIIWQLGIPFQQDRLTSRLRYCVLARADRRCQRSACDDTVLTTELIVMPVVPIGLGGRWVFDNLHALCSRHASEQSRATRQRGVTSIRRQQRATRRRGFVR